MNKRKRCALCIAFYLREIELKERKKGETRVMYCSQMLITSMFFGKQFVTNILK
jgi:hypothetical protein